MAKNNQFRQLWSEVKTQRFAPTERRIGRTWLEEFQRKEFETGNLLEVFHENTKLNRKRDIKETTSLLQFSESPRYKYLQMNAPEYPHREKVDLPDPASVDVSLGTVVRNRRAKREMTGEPLTRQELSTFLYYTCGVTERRDVDVSGMGSPEDETAEQCLRAYPSGGGLYPVRPYLLITNPCEELDRGLYFYTPDKHALRVIKRDPELPERIEADSGLFRTFPGTANPVDAGVTLVLTAQFWRSMIKYGLRSYRLVLQESGHVAQNALLAAEGQGFAATPLSTYNDDPLNEYLEVNGVDEAVVYSVAVGRDASGRNGSANNRGENQ